MADAQANIGINLDASAALAQLKNLQRQISLFNTQIAKGGDNAARSAANLQRNLANSINATGQFSASMARITSSTESFTNSLEKNKFSMGEYFRYAGGASKKFSHLFTNEFNTIEKVARERVKTLQTQYIKLGRDASGALKAIAVRPLSLDMNNLATTTALAAQKQQIFNQLLRQGSTNLLNWGKNTQWAGRQLMVGFTIPLTIFGAAAASSFMKIEQQAIRFKRVFGDAFSTDADAEVAVKTVRELALEFTKYGVEVEKTMELAADAAQMGLTGAKLTAQITEATRLAVLGEVEQQEALKTTISLTNAFGVSAEDLASKIDFLNAVENETVTAISDLTIAIPKAGPVIRQLGGDVEDLAFLLTAMKEGGINASEGANALKSGLASLINPSGQARDMLRGFGIDIQGIVQANKGDVSALVVDFARALDQLDPLNRAQAIEQMFGKFQFSRISTLFQNVIQEGTQAEKVLGLSKATLEELASLSQSELGKLEASPLYKFQAAIAEFQAALAPVGEAFLKLVTPIIEIGSKILNAFNNLSEGAKGFIVGLLGVVGGIAPLLIMGVGLIANGFANFTKILLGAQTVYQKLRNRLMGLSEGIDYMSQEQLEAAAVAASLDQSHAALVQRFTAEADAVRKLASEYRAMIIAQSGALGVPIKNIATTVPGFKNGRKVPGYKDGVVMVPGPKGAGDIQPAMLAPGEAVIPAKMAEKYGPLINAMIAGNIPGYDGGKAVASHMSGADPHGLASMINSLAEAGYTFKATVYRINENAEDLTLTVDRVTGNLHELVSETDLLVAGGSTFAGTTVPESTERNAMYNALGISGGAKTMDELFDQEEYLNSLRERAKTDDAVRISLEKHKVEVDSLIAESQEARAILEQSNNQSKTKLDYDKERARQAIAFAKITQEGMSQEEAEQQAGKKVEEADVVYAQAIRDGISEEEALSKARMSLLASMIESGSGEFVSSERSGGTDRPRAYAAGKVWATNDPIRAARREAGLQDTGFVQRTFADEGVRLNPRPGEFSAPAAEDLGLVDIQANSQKLIAAARQGIAVMVDNVVTAMEQELKNKLQSSSPSKVIKNEMGNVVDAAVLAVKDGQDDMRLAGTQLAEATVDGVESAPRRKRGDPSRVQTAGPAPAGTQPNYAILNSQIVEASTLTSQFGERAAAAGEKAGLFAQKAIDSSNKLGAIGIAASSVVGGFSMMKGPVGEFAQKLFPVISTITGLTYALQFLKAEVIQTAIQKAALQVLIGKETIARIRSTQSIATEVTARRASTGAMVLFSGGLGKGLKGILGNFGNIFKNLGKSLGTFGKIISTMFLTIGRVIGAVLGLTPGVGQVVAILALLVGAGIGLNKVIQDQRDKIYGLGDAASVSAKRLRFLSGVLGRDIEERKLIAPTAFSPTTIAGIDSEGRVESSKVTETLLTPKSEGGSLEEFREEYKRTLAALKRESADSIAAALEQQAISLKLQGVADSEIKGIIDALLKEAGRTDVKINLQGLEIANTADLAADAANRYFEEYERRLAYSFENKKTEYVMSQPVDYETGTKQPLTEAELANIQSQAEQEAFTFAGEGTAEFEDAVNQVSQGLANLKIAYDDGLIDLETYTEQSNTLWGLLASGPQGYINAVKEALGQKFDSDPFTDIPDTIGGQYATGIMQSRLALGSAEAAGVDTKTGPLAKVNVTPDDLDLFKQASAEDADPEIVAKADARIAKINRLTAAIEVATVAKNKFEADKEEQDTFIDETEATTAGLKEQAGVYDEVNDLIADNTTITEKAAFAQKVANDEALRSGLIRAKQLDLEDPDGGTKNVDAWLESTKDLINAEEELARVNADNQIDVDIESMENQLETYDNALIAAKGLVGETEAQAIAHQIAADAALQDAFALAQLTDVTNGTSAATDALIERLALRNQLEGKVAEIPRGGKSAGGGGGTQASFLDDIVKASRNLGDANQKLTTGFEASLSAILNMVDGVAWASEGLASQLRRSDVPETLIEKFLGMDPKEWEKTKKTLFSNIDGKLVLNEKGKKVMEAFAQSTIAQKKEEIEAETKSTLNQIDAFKDLRDMGYSTAEAFQIVQDKKVADAIATAENTAQVRELIAAQRELNKAQEQYEEISESQRISESIVKMNKGFAEQVKAVTKLTQDQRKYTDAQINAILSNDDLTKLFLKPKINSKALAKALEDANKKANLEIKIKRLTLEGQEELFSDGISKAMEAFAAMEQNFEIQFNAKIKSDSDLVKSAEEQLALIDFELDDYQAGLTEIDRAEDLINKGYDKRLEALDEIVELNKQIQDSQASQLDLASALSKGDIAAAAKAAQALRAKQQQSALENQRKMLETARRTEIARLTSASGLSREQLEERIRLLEQERFRIEENSLEPAQERIRLAELQKIKNIEQLTVLGKTREEWDRIQNRVDLAAASGWRFADAMKEALNIVEKLVKNLGGSKGRGLSISLAASRFAFGGVVNRSRSAPPQQMSDGGKVNGPGTQRSDSVPAMLSDGEYVIQAPTVRALGVGFLDKLNKNKGKGATKDGLPAFAVGGYVRRTPTPIRRTPTPIRRPPITSRYKPIAPVRKPVSTTSRGAPGSALSKPKPTVSGSDRGLANRAQVAQQKATQSKAVATTSRGGPGGAFATANKPTLLSQMTQPKNNSKAKFSDSFRKFDGTAVGTERMFQAMGQSIAENKVVQAIGGYLGSKTAPGSTGVRAILGALSVPVEIMGAIAKNMVTSTNPNASMAERLKALVPGRAVWQGVSNAFSGVINPENQKQMMFSQAGNYVADNKLFGATDAEGQARARLVGGALNILGDPLTYLGVGLGVKAVKGTAAAGRLTSGAASSTSGILPKYLKPTIPTANRNRPIPTSSMARPSTGEIALGENAITTYSIGKNKNPVVFQGPGQDFSNLAGKPVNVVNPTPQGLLKAALTPNAFSLKNIKLNSMLKNFESGKIGPRETRLLDEMQASVSIDDVGMPRSSEDISGLASVIMSLSGDKAAQQLINSRRLAFDEIIRKNALKNKDSTSLGSGEIADARKVSVIHSTKYPIQRDSAGNIVLRPLANYDKNIPRASLHFTLEDTVKSHMFGQWDDTQKKIVAPLSSMMDSNGLPYNLNVTDTWWMRGPGQDLKIPGASVISPYTDSSVYVKELIKRGLLQPGKMPPVMAVDKLNREILHISKKNYSVVDRFQMKKFLGYTPRAGQEAEAMSAAALKAAKEQIGTDTSARRLEQHGTTDFAFDQSIGNLASKIGAHRGTHSGSIPEGIERLGYNPADPSSLYFNPVSVDSVEALRFAALKGMFRNPVRSLLPDAPPRKAINWDDLDDLDDFGATSVQNTAKANQVVQPQSSLFLKMQNLKNTGIPLDTNYKPGVNAKISDFFEDSSGNKLFVKDYGNDELPALVNEFLAGQLGKTIGANTPESFLVKSQSGYTSGVATRAIPDSTGIHRNNLVDAILKSGNTTKTLEDMFRAFAEFNQKTPALNAIFRNTDTHAANVMWSESLKKFFQIDFGESQPRQIKRTDGTFSPNAGSDGIFQEAAKGSMITIRNSLGKAINDLIDRDVFKKSEQLDLAQRVKSFGFTLPVNKKAANPLENSGYQMDVVTDLSSAYSELANIDVNALPNRLASELGLKTGSSSVSRILNPRIIQNLKEAAEFLQGAGPIKIAGASKGSLAPFEASFSSSSLGSSTPWWKKELEKYKGKTPPAQSSGPDVSWFRMGGLVPYKATGGIFKSLGTDTVPAMLTPGEFVIRRSAVEKFGIDNLQKVNNGTYGNNSMYNYNLNVNVKSDANPEEIASTVMRSIRQVEGRRIRGNSYNG
jgi:TP901 family phage tail tape measure protein